MLGKRATLFLLAGVLLIGALVLAFPMGVAAQRGTPPADGGLGRAAGGMRGAFGNGWMAGGVPLVEAVAQATGLPTEDVVAALQDGQTYAQIVASKGKTLQDVVDVAVQARSEALQQAVADGRFTQEQADTMLSSMSEHLMAQLEAGWTPGSGGMGSRGGSRGAMRGRGRGGYGDPASCPLGADA
jgi:hypothetical protein